MKVEDVAGFIFELDEDEMKMVSEIAAQNGCTVAEAISRAIKNFLIRGVQTPNNERIPA